MGRPPRSFGCVTVSVVLRLASAALDAGRLAGEVELVATGERGVVRSVDELLAFLARSAAEDLGEDRHESAGGETMLEARDAKAAAV